MEIISDSKISPEKGEKDSFKQDTIKILDSYINSIKQNIEKINNPEEKLNYLYEQLKDIHIKNNIDDEKLIKNKDKILGDHLEIFVKKLFIKLYIYQVYIKEFDLGSIFFFQKPYLLKYFEYFKSIQQKLDNKTSTEFISLFNELFLYLDENLFDELKEISKYTNNQENIEFFKNIKDFFDTLAHLEIKYYKSTYNTRDNLEKLKEIYKNLKNKANKIKTSDIDNYYFKLAEDIYKILFENKELNIETHSKDEIFLWYKNSFIINKQNNKEINNLQVIRLSINFFPLSKSILWYHLNKGLFKNKNYFITLNHINHCIDKLEQTFSEKHSYRVGELAKKILEIVIKNEDKLPEAFSEEINELKKLNKFYMILFGKIHDIGKLFVNWIWLGYRGKLGDKFKYLKEHTDKGYMLLDNFFKELPKDLQEYLIQAFLHHENLDGSGYPWGIKDVPLLSQIIKIADITDAILSKRYYDEAKDIDYLLSELKKEGEKNINSDLIKLILSPENKNTNEFINELNKLYNKETTKKAA